MANWRAPWLDRSLEFWHKKFTDQQQRLTKELNNNVKFLSNPSWLGEIRTAPIQKDAAKGNAVSN